MRVSQIGPLSACAIADVTADRKTGSPGLIILGYMAAFILTWNPDRWTWAPGDYDRAVRTTASGARRATERSSFGNAAIVGLWQAAPSLRMLSRGRIGMDPDG
jgi:hypothetical protein